eukprot:8710929-Pyramimonas_sp.AAC.1
MLNANGVPTRALYGGLAGAQQTVGRAERVAGLKALQYMPSVQCVISDLLEFVNEGKLWGRGGTEALTDASRACPAVRRQLVAPKRTPPAVARV